MPLWKFVALINGMAEWRNYTQRSLAMRCGLDEGTVSQWAVWVREAFAVINKHQLITLGGQEKIVYVDVVSAHLGVIYLRWGSGVAALINLPF